MQSHQVRDRGVTTVKPFQFRGRFFTALALRLSARPDESLLAAIDAELRQTPQFFAGAPLVIDLEQASSLTSGDDLLRLIEHLRFRRISVFGVQGASPEQVGTAASLGLISLAGGRDAPARGVAREETRDAEPAKEPSESANLLISTPIRSGQTVVAEKGDLTVVGPVGSGAELIAAGNIHVYGHLRGRASAGVYGDDKARIFCQSLDAELLSIAGLYRTNETLDGGIRKQNVQVFLQGDRLCVEVLGQPQTRDRSGQ